MQLRILSVGKIKHPWWRDAAQEYAGRLRAYTTFHEVEVRAARKIEQTSLDRALKEEADALLAQIDPAHYASTFRLDERGKTYSSDRFASILEDHMLYQSKTPLTFVIGGAFGYHTSIRKTLTRTLSLSPMTMPHELARVVLTEQLYRSMTIIRGEPYHK